MRQTLVVSLLSILSLAVVASADTGTVVIGVGETLLAGEAESFLETALSDADIEMIDERGLLQVEELLGDRTGPLTTEVITALRPHAGTVVLVRAEYLGDRPLFYLQRMDSAYQSRLIVTVIDLASAEPGESLLNKKVEYTHINAGDIAERTLRPKVRKLVELLGG